MPPSLPAGRSPAGSGIRPLRRRAPGSVHGTARVKAGLRYPGRPVVPGRSGSFRPVRDPLARIPGHHPRRVQRMPGALLIHNPQRAAFHHHDEWRRSTEPLDPPAPAMRSASRAVSLEPQHDPMVAHPPDSGDPALLQPPWSRKTTKTHSPARLPKFPRQPGKHVLGLIRKASRGTRQ
jgi:hypothetical protein